MKDINSPKDWYLVASSSTPSFYSMKVTFDSRRVLHLAALIVATYFSGRYLVDEWDMSALSAYGLGCFDVCQVSNMLLWLLDEKSPAAVAPHDRTVSSSTTTTGGTNKKNKQN